MRRLTWEDVRRLAAQVAARHVAAPPDGVYGIPSGGSVVAPMVAEHLATQTLSSPRPGCLVVDDLVDSGATAQRILDGMAWGDSPGVRFDALSRKTHSPAHLAPDAPVLDGWLVYPWEQDAGPTDAVVRLLQHVGEDPSRDGLLDTPKRVVKALGEMTVGYGMDPAAVLATTFDVQHDQMVVVRRIPFVSLCEHHVLPFTGHATVAYLPGDGVVGLSKLARLVDCYARRLQVQERLTDQIAHAINDHLQPVGVGVIVSAQHSCMSARGVGKAAEMVTSAMLGSMRDDASARAELLSLHAG